MATKTIELLLTENVDSLGIVGDVVKVRFGFARNYLLPHGLATTPSDDAIQALAVRREQAERMMRELRSERETMISKLEGFEISIERSCNDLGHLYGSVTQKDISEALGAEGFSIKPREVRLAQTIKRVDSYDVHIKLDQDLETEVKLWVVPDRQLHSDEREEMEFDNEGNLIEKRPERKKEQAETPSAEEGAEAAEASA